MTVRIIYGVPFESRHIHTIRVIADRQIEVKVFDAEPFVLTPREALALAKGLRRIAKTQTGGHA